MTRKKVLAKIPFQLMTKDQVIALKLEEQPYYLIIPKSILQKLGVTNEKISFDLVEDDNRLCLVGPRII